MQIADYEKVATIVSSFADGYSEGNFGKATDISGTGWNTRVEVKNGPCVLVRKSMQGAWEVQFKSMCGVSFSLEEAAQLALEAGRGVSISRNYSVKI